MKKSSANMINEIEYALKKAREFDEDNFNIACYLCGYLESLLKNHTPDWNYPKEDK